MIHFKSRGDPLAGRARDCSRSFVGRRFCCARAQTDASISPRLCESKTGGEMFSFLVVMKVLLLGSGFSPSVRPSSSWMPRALIFSVVAATGLHDC